MIEPKHPTEEYIEGRIAFHESGMEWYRAHDQPKLAEWSKAEAEKWRAKLKAREPGEGE